MSHVSPVTRIHTLTATHALSAVHTTVAGGLRLEAHPVEDRRRIRVSRLETRLLRLKLLEMLATEPETPRLTRIVTRFGQLSAAASPETQRMLDTPPLPRVFAKAAAPVIAVAEGGVLRAAEQAAGSGDEQLLPSGRTAAPAVDIEGLTDSVMRAIDQRLVSARERLGMV